MTETIQKTENGISPVGVDAMIAKAIEKDNIDAIEKLLMLKERVDKENARKSFKDAFAQWQAEKPDIKRTKTVSFGNTKYSYAPLSSIQKQVDQILSKVGLLYRWEQEQKNSKINITCIVSHVHGHEERTVLEADNDTSGNKNSIQSVGSTVTYLKRYTLEAALGLSSDYDDDGKEAGKEAPKLPELHPKHKHWKAIVDGIRSGQTNIEALKAKKYTISEKVENQLKEELTK
jgi:hypothetical protein